MIVPRQVFLFSGHMIDAPGRRPRHVVNAWMGDQ